jgi:hypothetical protein
MKMMKVVVQLLLSTGRVGVNAKAKGLYQTWTPLKRSLRLK